MATAIRLGLLQEGEGETVEEALSDLKEIIVNQQSHFEKEDKRKIVGYARLARTRLSR